MSQRMDAFTFKPHDRSCGFTLMEVIIAMSLVSLLMLLSWSMFYLFTRLEEKGSQRALEQQLVRAMLQQFRSDLQRLAMPGTGMEVAPAKPGATRAPQQVALVGTRNSLDILIRVPAARVTISTRTIPGLHQWIQYRFTPPRVSRAPLFGSSAGDPESDSVDATSPYAVSDASHLPSDAGEMRPGERDANQTHSLAFQPPSRLGLRRESYWLAPPRDRRDQQAGQETTVRLEDSPLAAFPQTNDEWLGASDTINIGNADRAEGEWQERVWDEHDDAPEITSFRLRYFDGQQWADHWDSRVEGELPAAVEFVFELNVKPPRTSNTDRDAQSAEQSEEALRALSETETSSDEEFGETSSDRGAIDRDDMLETESVMNGANQPQLRDEGTQYRLVVAVPGYLPLPPATPSVEEAP